MTSDIQKPDMHVDNPLQMPVKFLVVRLSSIGDIVLASPVLRCLKQQVDGAEVHFLTKEQFLPVVKANPYIDRIHIYEGTIRTIRKLRNEGFHYVIDLQNNLRTALFKSRISAIPFSFNKLNTRKWLMVNFKRNMMPDIHLVDRYLDTLKLFDVVNDGKGLDHFIPPEEEVSITDLPQPFHNGYVLFAIGALHNTKRLPAEKICEVCRELNLPVILAGDKNDVATGETVASGCGKLVLNACGRYSINQSASLVRQADVVITHDSGLMHIAAAYKKKIVSVWGNTVPAFGMYPYMPNRESAIFEVGGLSCRPCSKLGFRKCPKKHFRCMNDHDTGEIARYVRKLYTRG